MTYPDDIMKTARACYRGTALCSVYDEEVELIARAIMAERQRAADIAWQHMPACQDAQYEDGAGRVASIAEAIERGDHV